MTMTDQRSETSKPAAIEKGISGSGSPISSLPSPFYTDDFVTIYHGDCRDVLPMLRQRFEAIITDPPYAIPTQVAQTRTITRNVGDLSIAEAGLEAMFRECDRRLIDGGRYFVFCDGTSYPVLSRVFYGRFTTALLVWDKGRIGMGREFRKSHELILHAWERQTPLVDANGKGYADVLRCAPVGDDRVHDAQKPVGLISQLLRVCGANVLDPFAGSGTTLVAAKQDGHKAVGIEIDERNCELAANRCRQGVLF